MIRTAVIAIVIALASGAAIAREQARFFGERHRIAVREFYNEQMRAGSCPTGFAKKDDGCEAPVRPRKWAVGKSLPPDAIRFEVPRALAAKLGPPPKGHRYVRVGADVLLVSNSSKLVADGIVDLGRR